MMEPFAYPGLRQRLACISADELPLVVGAIARDLSWLWTRLYRGLCPGATVLETHLGEFTYLFDPDRQRNVAAGGFIAGHNKTPRDAHRMREHPKSEGRDYHRGHMMPHSGGGGTDINLFSQRGAVNVSQSYRELEKLAVATPGSFYFVRLLYGAASGQRPAAIEQGLIIADPSPRLDVRSYLN